MSGSSKKSPKKSGKKKKPMTISRGAPVDEEGYSGAMKDHKHCYNCGISISPSKDICSDKCQVEWDKMMKRKKLMTYLPFIGIALLILFYILVYANS